MNIKQIFGRIHKVINLVKRFNLKSGYVKVEFQMDFKEGKLGSPYGLEVEFKDGHYKEEKMREKKEIMHYLLGKDWHLWNSETLGNSYLSTKDGLGKMEIGLNEMIKAKPLTANCFGKDMGFISVCSDKYETSKMRLQKARDELDDLEEKLEKSVKKVKA